MSSDRRIELGPFGQKIWNRTKNQNAGLGDLFNSKRPQLKKLLHGSFCLDWLVIDLNIWHHSRHCFSLKFYKRNKCKVGHKSQISIYTKAKIVNEAASPGFQGFWILSLAKVISNFCKILRIMSESFSLGWFGRDQLKELKNKNLSDIEKCFSILMIAGGPLNKQE